MRIIRFIRAWFYYSTFRNYLYSEGTKPAQTRFQYAKKHSKITLRVSRLTVQDDFKLPRQYHDN